LNDLYYISYNNIYFKAVQLDNDANKSEINNNNNNGNNSKSQPSQVKSRENESDDSLKKVGVVVTSLQFVISMTNEEEKIPQLLLVAGSANGIYLIFSIS